MIDNKNRFVIPEYDKTSTFASFLPGVSGIKGIPIWCYYVNRGQCITSFGVQDKDHSIMEFYPAHQAYQRTKRMGFRTFMKVNGQYRESFASDATEKTMHIGMNELVIQEEDKTARIRTSVCYYTLPQERLGGLVREVTITNMGGERVDLELVDGMTEMIPFGVDLPSMKDMAQTSQAWMEVQDHETGVPYSKVRVDMTDSAEVTEIRGGHFGFAYDEEKELLPVVVSQEHLFSYDTTLEQPLAFQKHNIDTLIREKQMTQNHLPCCFFMAKKTLEAGASVTFYEVYGASSNKELLQQVVKKAKEKDYFSGKRAIANQLTEEVTQCIGTKTGDQVFDEYCRQTYLDNVLRGGYPITLGKDKLFYVYSRKHGDIERDYNFFRMQPEFFSQGNGNFRDVNQNRRSDVLFSPVVTDQNIHIFYDCIQLNGYNPLGIEKITYHLPGEETSFTPGAKYEELLDQSKGDQTKADQLFEQVMEQAVPEQKTDFIEGCWSDHWTYNLDLVESYVSVYPDREEKLLFEDHTYSYKQAACGLLPRRERYVETANGIRQYNYLRKLNPVSDYTLDKDQNRVTATLFEKIYLLCVTKMAALDPYGMGIEMEGGKPGWYDALNGLPGILGSSMCETYELERNLEYLIQVMKKYQESTQIQLLKEVADFADAIAQAAKKHREDFARSEAQLAYWNEVNDKKEQYWKETDTQVSGEKVGVDVQALLNQLETFKMVVSAGIKKAVAYGKGIGPAYFYYNVKEYEKTEAGILPTSVELVLMPAFLEGPVRHLKLDASMEEKQTIYSKVKGSQLYDQKLQMYKVNTSLKDASFEIGRCKAFTPGWLENESIWLHMEYKYLLELLKSGLYTEYLEDFHKAAVPFLDEKVYGRSLFENSSFLASSANPDEKIHGKGFVSRLSGSTAEFLQMWQIMMFGKQPFVYEDGKLALQFEPLIPAYLVGEDKKIEAVFRGQIPVVYHLKAREDYIPGEYQITSGKITTMAGEVISFTERIEGAIVEEIRKGNAKQIEMTLMA
ncbi:MAG: hypothetical protein PHG16_04910 [Lachnospiraceae bacterium]|nr:hypothetical protein [Lachnospiraceae bacterium]